MCYLGFMLSSTFVYALFDELEKIASLPAATVNRAMGLPLKPDTRKIRYDHGSEADAAYRSHSMMFGDQNPNYASSEITTVGRSSPAGV